MAVGGRGAATRAAGDRRAGAARRGDPAAEVHRGVELPTVGRSFGRLAERRRGETASRSRPDEASAGAIVAGTCRSALKVLEMNHEIQDNDDVLFDRLVDGELSADERRHFLTSLDDRPDGWRRCAIAFLEAQS